MIEKPFDAAAFLDAASTAAGLTITEAQRPGVLNFLEIARRMQEIVAAAPVPADDFHLAPVFRPNPIDGSGS